MREAKTAIFDQVIFGAQMENGVLTALNIASNGGEGSKVLALSATETRELREWLGTLTGEVPVNRTFPALVTSGAHAGPAGGITNLVSSLTLQAPVPIPTGYTSLDDRGTLPVLSGDDAEVRATARAALALPHASDATTVKHLLKVEDMVKRELPGGVMESREVNIPVRFSK